MRKKLLLVPVVSERRIGASLKTERPDMVPRRHEGRKALGPRYIEFHPTLPICYVAAAPGLAALLHGWSCICDAAGRIPLCRA